VYEQASVCGGRLPPYVMRADFAVSGGLAYTGASIALPLVGGLGALGIGGGLLVASRRRNSTTLVVSQSTPGAG
jgi:LPXTG-motif cell wall-anchored protein